MDWYALRAAIIANTGWTWDEAGRLTVPRLNALTRYWTKHPPTHLLVALYMNYEAPPEALVTSASEAADSEPMAPQQTPWLAGMGAVPANDALRQATTPMESIEAMERMFFGTLVER